MGITTGLFSIALAAPLIWISIVDLDDLTIPNSLVAMIGLLGLVFLFIIQTESLLTHILAGITGFLFFWITGEIFYRLRGIDGLGIGDAKLLGAGGIWVGFEGLMSVVFLASVGGMIFAMISRVRLGSKLDPRIPFGPFLSVAIFVVWVHGAILF